MKMLACLVFVFMVIGCVTSTFAQDKVVVIPLMEDASKANYYLWVYDYAAISDSDILYGTIMVPASAGIIKKLEVLLFIGHTHNDDLDVELIHSDSGRRIWLFTDIGGSGDGIYVNLDDDAATDLSFHDQSNLPIAGDCNPEGDAKLATFNGIDASGLWFIKIVDDSLGDDGTLNSATLIIYE